MSAKNLTRYQSVLDLAVDVFGDTETASKWLESCNIALGAAPIEWLDSEERADEVRKILNAIAFGGTV